MSTLEEQADLLKDLQDQLQKLQSSVSEKDKTITALEEQVSSIAEKDKEISEQNDEISLLKEKVSKAETQAGNNKGENEHKESENEQEKPLREVGKELGYHENSDSDDDEETPVVFAEKHTPLHGFKVEMPKFGGKSTDSLNQWLFQLDQIFTTKRTPSSHQASIAGLYLTDFALKWYQSHVRKYGVFKSYTFFQKKLREEFQESDTQIRARRALIKLSQTSSVKVYNAGFRELAYKIDNQGEEDAIAAYYEGLRFNILKEVKPRHFKTLEQVMRFAEDIDECQFPSSYSQQPSRDFKSGNRPFSQGQKSSYSSPKPSPAPSNQSRSEINALDGGPISGSAKGQSGGRRDFKPKDKSKEKCHRCGITGHYARECTSTTPLTQSKNE